MTSDRREDVKGRTKRSFAWVLAASSATALAWFALLGPGCGGSSSTSGSTAPPGLEDCTSACDNTLALTCDNNCDCSKCMGVPASCAGALKCAASATTCKDLNACPAPPADCQAFLATVCP